jgi:DNA-directed RNA polymerase specialized sigma24 family protein
MHDDTSLGGPNARFPVTRWSAIVAARSGNAGERRRALETLAAAYWKPIYKYIRLRWGRPNEDAKDLTQGFFARLVEKDLLANYDPSRARLRTYLRICVDGYVANEDKAAGRQKRGGDAIHLALDFDAAEHELAHATIDPAKLPAAETLDDFFEKEWVRSLFSLAVERLQERCGSNGKMMHFRLFEEYDLDDEGERRLSYEQLAQEHAIPVTDVTNFLAWARREFRRITLELLREMTGSEEEFQREARAVLGVDLT